MSKRKQERSANYDFYADALWCTVPLVCMSCFYYGPRPALLYVTALLTAYLCDCALTPLHAPGYQTHEPSSEYFAAMIVMLLPASISYAVVVAAVVVAVLAKEAFGGEGHYPFHPAAVGVAVAGVSWPQSVFYYPEPGTSLPLWGTVEVSLVAGMNSTIKDGGLPTASTINLLIGNVAGPMGASAVLVILGCGLYLLCRGHLKLTTFLPFLAVCVAIPWLAPQLNELPAFSLPWQHIRQKVYLEKYIVLSGTALFGGVFLACEPVTQPDRTASRIIYGLALGLVTTIFRFHSSFETSVCFALLIVGAIPEWLDRAGRRTERMRFMRKEAQRLADQQKRTRR